MEVCLDRGYIKVWRKIEDWEWFKDTQTMGFFLYLMLRANYKDSRYMGHEIPRGALVCGRKKLAEELSLSEKTVRTLLTRLKTTNEVAIKTTNRFSIVFILNYNKYQEKWANETANNTANDGPTKGQQVATSKEVKNKRSNNNSPFNPPTIEETTAYFENELSSSKDKAIEFFQFYGSKGWVVGKSPMKNWHLAAQRSLKWGGSTKTEVMSSGPRPFPKDS